MFNNDQNDRFKTIYTQGTISRCKIILDTQTGVNYLLTSDGYAGGLTVLLDKDGKPVTTPVD